MAHAWGIGTRHGAVLSGGPTNRAARAKRRQLRERAADVGDEIDHDAVFDRHNGLCLVCKLPVARELATFDHIVPISKGGEDTEENQAPAHRACNSQKKDDPLVGPKARKPGIRRTRRMAAVARRFAS